MKKLIILLLFTQTFCFGQTVNQVIDVNIKASKLRWTGYSEVGDYSLSGTIQLKKGLLEFNGKAIKKGEFIFEMNTISSENKDLEKHLKADDFFDIEKFPTAIFQLISIEKGIVRGFLTIKGIKKEVRFPLKSNLKNNQIIVSGKVSVDRTQFNIKYNSNSFFDNLGSYAIKNNFDLVFEIVAEKNK